MPLPRLGPGRVIFKMNPPWQKTLMPLPRGPGVIVILKLTVMPLPRLGPGRFQLKIIRGDGASLLQKLTLMPLPLPRLGPGREGWLKNGLLPDAAGTCSANFEG